MSKTRADLCTQVLIALGRATEVDDPSDEDMTRVDGFVDPVVKSLSARDIYTVGDSGVSGPVGGAIEDEIFLDLADCVAFRAAQAFGVPITEGAELAALAESRMKTIAAPVRSLRRLRVDPALAYCGYRRF